MKKLVSILTLALMLTGFGASAFAAEPLICWFPPGWKSKAVKARAITQALSEESGVKIRPRIAKSYPEILKAFATDRPNLVYVGSFVQAIIKARSLGTPLVQNINGKDLYCGVMVYRKKPRPEDGALKAPPEGA
ncbi:hypothetical protein C2E25_15605, partial [Geothermobacter hydrogeniphilus]